MDHYFTNNENLKSEIKTINYEYNGYSFSFLSDNGVFSKNHIDYGSRLLVETFLENTETRGKVLDVGCGYGFMGIVIAKILDIHVTMIDVNKRAVHLAKRNIDKMDVNAEAFISNVYENINDKYDFIITNPPVRAGKSVLLDILINAKEHLTDDGQLWYVLRKDQGAKSMQKALESVYKVENICKSKGFYVFLCKKH